MEVVKDQIGFPNPYSCPWLPRPTQMVHPEQDFPASPCLPVVLLIKVALGAADFLAAC